MENRPGPQAQPQAAHAQPVDPVADALQGAADGEPGQAPSSDPNQLQEVLPEIKDLAQKVGGMKKLAEIAETLEQTEG
jgi:hypothetical protein